MSKKTYSEKNCAFPDCGDVFTPTGGGSLYCKPTHEVVCIRCAQTVIIKSTAKENICKQCRIDRGNERRIAVLRERYGEKGPLGDKAVQEKIKKTNLERYGAENPQGSKEIRDKTSATNLERYGVKVPAQNKEQQEKQRKNNLERYGVEHHFEASTIKEKIKKTNLERYGAEAYTSSSDFQEKSKASFLNKYGVSSPGKAPEIRAKIKKTNLERYGAESSFGAKSVQEKISATNLEKYGNRMSLHGELIAEKVKKTMIERYGVEFSMQSKELLSKGRNSTRERYGVDYGFLTEAAKEKSLQARIESGNPGRISKRNRVFAEKLSSTFTETVIFEPRLDEKSYADLSVGNILIDINPTFTHNSFTSLSCVLKKCKEIPCLKHKPTANDRHFKRAQLALEQNLSYVQIYDWDDPERVMNFLRGKLERGWEHHSARKLELRSLPQKLTKEFLEEYHIQGTVRGQSYRYGLFSEEELLAVATFGNSRFKSKASHEWLRYAVKRGHIVHGGAGRLWKAFLEQVSPESVISYVDFDHTTKQETFFSSLEGWVEGKPTGPSKVWSKLDKRLYNNSLIRQGADRLLGTAYGSREDSGLNNEQIMLLEGWLPIHTAGNRVFHWRAS